MSLRRSIFLSIIASLTTLFECLDNLSLSKASFAEEESSEDCNLSTYFLSRSLSLACAFWYLRPAMNFLIGPTSNSEIAGMITPPIIKYMGKKNLSPKDPSNDLPNNEDNTSGIDMDRSFSKNFLKSLLRTKKRIGRIEYPLVLLEVSSSFKAITACISLFLSDSKEFISSFSNASWVSSWAFLNTSFLTANGSEECNAPAISSIDISFMVSFSKSCDIGCKILSSTISKLS